MQLIIYSMLVLFISCVFSVDPLVRTKQGLVRGRRALDGLYSQFLGIPYAQVDLNYPFRAATAPQDFENEIFDAYDGSVVCPQMINKRRKQFIRFKETADCLRLNIYVPYEASYTNPMNVMLWIHGGSYTVGYGTEYDPIYLVDKGIIVVTINYRLGPYGFLCLDDPHVSGNRGLKDQYLALRWINDNIAAFGGNASDITLAGQDAGAVSALLHLYSRKDKLFNKIIVQSGTPQSIEEFVEGDHEAAVKLARYLNFNTTDIHSALDFLSGVPTYQVTDAAVDLSLILKPCKENIYSGVDFIIDSYPIFMAKQNKVKGTSVLIGHTSNEAGSLINVDENFKKGDPFREQLNVEFDFNDDEIEEVLQSVTRFYIGEKDLSNSTRSEIVDFRSDLLLCHPILRTITNLNRESAAPIYKYVFSPANSNNRESGVHGSELPYLFRYSSSEVTNDEKTLLQAERMITLWANFVKYGNPTPETTDLLPVIWKPVTTKTRLYLDISEKLELKSRVFKRRMAFWDLFHTIYGKNHRLSRECN